jgi:DNA-binding LacI/PurR family transcriptional regulator
MVNISDPFHNYVSQGLESVAYDRGYTTLVCDAHSPGRVADYIVMLQQRAIDGAVFHHLDITPGQVSELKSSGVHSVLMDNESVVEGAGNLITDNGYGARLATEHLIARGHKTIACMHGTLQRPRQKDVPFEDTFQFGIWRERTRGFQDAMRSHGLDDGNLYKGNGLSHLAPGYARRALDHMMTLPDRPTAIYCENDIMAIAVLNDLLERGLKVPDDLAIVGHDGLDLAQMIHPRLTTVAQPRYEMGSAAGRMLIESIEDGVLDELVTLSPKLLLGETT